MNFNNSNKTTIMMYINYYSIYEYIIQDQIVVMILGSEF